MKKNIIQKGFLLLLSIAFIGCSTTSKLANSWTSKDFSAAKQKMILVVGKSKDAEVRKAYETSIANKLKANNLKAVESYTLFPDLKDDPERTEEETKAIIKMLKDKGIGSVMLISLKDKKTVFKWPEDLSTANSQSVNNFKSYRVSFTSFYDVSSNDYLARSLRPRYGAPNYTEPAPAQESTTYLLEALLYDIELGDKQQLVSGFQVSFEEPKSAEFVLNTFTKIIGKQFK